MMERQPDPPATPMTVRDVLLLVLQADASPILGNEDVPVSLRMQRAALQHAEATEVVASFRSCRTVSQLGHGEMREDTFVELGLRKLDGNRRRDGLLCRYGHNITA